MAPADHGAETVSPPSARGSEASPDGVDAAGSDIKANADSMLYHTTASPYHGRTKADVWFDSETAAQLAGFTRWDRRDCDAGARTAPTASDGAEGAYGQGSADPAADGSGPAGYHIKGNANSMLYHTVDSVFYDITKAEVWFRTEADARRAGFRSFTS